MKGNATTQLVHAIRNIRSTGVSIATGTVVSRNPFLLRLTGSNLMLDDGDIDVLRNINPDVGDMLLLLASTDGQQYYAVGVY